MLKPSYDLASLARELSLLLRPQLLKSCALVLVDECDEHLKIIIITIIIIIITIIIIIIIITIIVIITLFTSKSYQAKLKHFRLQPQN